MAGFHDISFDLLYVIFSEIQSEKGQLFNLTLTCRSFREVAQRLLDRNATISKPEGLDLFLRTLAVRPELGHRVHRLDLDLLLRDIQPHKKQSRIPEIIGLLPNLRQFSYQSRDYKLWQWGIPFPFKSLRLNTYEELRKVEWHHNVTPDELLLCMRLPRIESIYFRGLRADSLASKRFSVPGWTFGNSSVVELRMGPNSDLPMETFRTLMQVPRSLRKLALNIQDQYVQHGLHVEAHRIAWMLEPIQETLEELDIPALQGHMKPSEQPADLSAFCSLRKLSIPLRYLFTHGPQTPYSLSELLPSSLKELRISFVSNNWSTPETIQNFQALNNWLRDAPESDGAQSRLPNLACVTLEASTFTYPYGDLNKNLVHEMVNNWGLSEEGGARRLELRHTGGGP